MATATELTLTGEQIRELRRARGWSQEYLARTVECSSARVKQLEAGFDPRRPSPVRDRIARVLLASEDAEDAATAA